MNPPLWLPHGSVRAVLAIGIVAGAFILYGIGKLVFDQLVFLTTPITMIYFGQYIQPNKSAEGVDAPMPSPVVEASPLSRLDKQQEAVHAL